MSAPRNIMNLVCGVAGLVLWLSGLAWGMRWMARYEAEPGAPAAAPARWPEASRIARPTGRPMLLVFLHPRCPCSRATLDELEAVLDTCRERGRSPAVRAVFFHAPGAHAGWEQTDLWRRVRAQSGIEIIGDQDEAERHRFGAVTSGQVVLYDRDGQLRFAGGVTRARGLAGANEGRQRLIALACGDGAPAGDTPVFGCSLEGEPLPGALP